MGVTAWVLWFVLDSVLTYWVVCAGGAQRIEGWKAGALIGFWDAWNWSAEQIRMVMLLVWIGHAVWFVLGLFNPGLRL